MLFNNFDLTDEEILKIINDYEPLIKRKLLNIFILKEIKRKLMSMILLEKCTYRQVWNYQKEINLWIIRHTEIGILLFINIMKKVNVVLRKGINVGADVPKRIKWI